jgi:hypothetical protein
VSWFRRKRDRRRDRETPRPAAAPRPTPAPSAERALPPQEPAPVTAAELRQAEFALAEGIVTSDSLREEIQRAGAEGTPLGRALLGLPYPGLQAVAAILGAVPVPRIDLDRLGPADDALERLPAETARARDCLPLAVFGNIICVAMARPEDLSGIREIRDVTGLRVKALRAEGSIVRSLIDRFYPATPLRSFRLRPLPVSPDTFERARRRNRLANEVAAEWESVWLHGSTLEAAPVSGDSGA